MYFLPLLLISLDGTSSSFPVSHLLACSPALSWFISPHFCVCVSYSCCREQPKRKDAEIFLFICVFLLHLQTSSIDAFRVRCVLNLLFLLLLCFLLDRIYAKTYTNTTLHVNAGGGVVGWLRLLSTLMNAIITINSVLFQRFSCLMRSLYTSTVYRTNWSK